MSLTEIANLIKQKWILVAILLLLILGVVVGWLISRYGPPVAKIEKLVIAGFPGKAKTFDVAELTIPNNLPEILPVFTLKPSGNFLSQSQTIAEKFGFKKQPKNIRDKNLGGGQTYSKENATLVIYKEVVSYQKIIEEKPGLSQNLELLKQKAKDFLASLGFGISQLAEPQITFLVLSGEDLVETKEQGRASFVRFDYPVSLFDLPVIPQANLASITLDFEGEIIDLNYRQFRTSPELGRYPIKSIQKALEELRSGQGSLIEISGESEDFATLANLGEVKLKKAYLAYYLPTKTQAQILPVWAFEGEAQVGGVRAKTIFVIDGLLRN